ncbi:MAG: ATP-dependent Clp protease adapter ClpS [Bacteriovoracaceae bacterium]|nr:ATP-dependent Clp protease adapter ClpS [Bacteriovoracaceae bacterium]
MSNKNDTEEKSGVATIKREKLQPPPKYKILMHNDDYTTMEFVILVLKKFFNKTNEEAHALMLKVHTEGMAICGIYTHEVAESKVAKVTGFARKEGHPLKLSFEPCE